MRSADTIARAIMLPGAAQGASSTAEFQFLGHDKVQANARVSPIPGSLFRMFKVRCGGRVTTGTTSNFNAILYSGKSTTIGSNTAIATTAAVQYASISHTWWLEATFSVDATALVMSGTYEGATKGAAVAKVALTTAAAANPAAEIAFTVTGNFATGHANNAAYLDYLEVEEL